jgi:hypothetical protein
MMSRTIRYTLVSILSLALAGSAFAQDPEEGGEMTPEEGGMPEGEGTPEGEPAGEPAADPAADPAMGGKPSMLLPKGKIGIHASIQLNLSKDLVAHPIAIQPDVWYGVMDKLEVGVVHSSYGLSGFWGSIGGGVCLAGEKDLGAGLTIDMCGGKAYNGPIGVLGHFLLMEGSIDLAADAGVVINRLDPFALGLKVGVRGRWMSGKLAVGFAPNIGIGLTERDTGNKEFLNIPVDVGFMATDKLNVGVQTGIAGPLDGFGDAWVLPVSVGGMFMVNDALGVGASFNLFRVAGGAEGEAFDARGLTVFAMWHN